MRKIGKLKYRKDDLEKLKKIVVGIKEEGHELNANLYVLKMVLDKSRDSTKDAE
jgi:hypothetical protein